MFRESSPQRYQFETITLDELVPEDHLVRKIDAAINFEFIRDAVAHLYCPDNGRPAIDPVRLIKMMPPGYLFGVPSERCLVKKIQVNVAYRWFLRMNLTEKVPDVSTLSQNRICRFNDSDVFQQIFDHIVELGQGMANGRVLYTDSTHLKANANPRKAVNERCPEGVSEYFAGLNTAVEADRKQHEKKPLPGVNLSEPLWLAFLCIENPQPGWGFSKAFSFGPVIKTPFDLLKPPCGLATARVKQEIKRGS